MHTRVKNAHRILIAKAEPQPAIPIRQGCSNCRAGPSCLPTGLGCAMGAARASSNLGKKFPALQSFQPPVFTDDPIRRRLGFFWAPPFLPVEGPSPLGSDDADDDDGKGG